MVCPQRLMDPNGFQRELEDIPQALLPGPAKVLVTAWKQKAVEALDMFVSMGASLSLLFLSFPTVHRGTAGFETG